MKHILKTFLLFLCVFVTGNVRADLVPEWQGKIAQRAENPTTELSEGWYILYNVGRRNCAFDNGSAYIMTDFPAAGTYFSAAAKGGMFFHITAAGNGKWHISSALGHNVALSRDNSSRPNAAVDFTIDHIGSSTDAFYILDTNSGYYADGQGTGGNFVGWENTPITSDTGNSAYKFYAVSATEAVEVTYHITATDAQGQNPISWSFSKYENIGTFAGGAALTNAYAYVDNYQCTTPDARISSTNHEFDFTATHAFPMVPSKKYQVRETGNGSRYMASIADNDDNVTLRATNSVDDAKTVWSVFSATDGPYFYLYNEARDKTMKVKSYANNDCVDYYPLGDAQAQAYEFVEGDQDGSFKLFVPTTGNNVGAHGYYGNPNQSLGLYGTGRDGGSSFIAEEVTPYTLTVEGNADGRVIYNETEYTDDTTLYFPLGATPTFTAKAIDNFDAVFDSEGPQVKVRYIDMSVPFFNITYRYVDAVTEALIESVTSSCRYETEFPAPKEFAGKHVLNAPKGTVTGNAEFTILVLTLDGEDQPDPVKPSTVQLTYRVVGSDGAVWYTETVTANNGEAYPALNTTLPVGVTLTMPTGTLSTMQTELTVDIPCTSTFALKYADSYNNIKQWYGVTITNAKTPFHYKQGDTYMTLSGSASYETKYLFALVGNPFTGFKLYNKAAGSGMILSSPDPATTTNGNGQYCWPVMTDESDLPDGNNIYWDFTANSSGYFISRHGESDFHLNSRADSGNSGSVLAYWNNTDNGSCVYFTPEGVEVLSSNPSTATATAASPATDKVYRIYSVRHGGRMIMENAEHKLMKTTEKQQGDLSQLWVLETSTTNSAFTLRNAETGRFIVAPTGNNAQVTTQTSAAPLYFIQKTVSTENGGNPYYGIGGNAGGTGNVWMNTNTNISNVVGWSLGDDGGSGWVIEEAKDVILDEVKAHVKGNSAFGTLESGKYYRLVNKMYPARRMIENYTGDNKVRGLENGVLPNDNAQIWQISGNASNGYTIQNAFTGHYIADQGNTSQIFPTTDQESSAKHFQTTTSGGDDWSAPQYAFFRTTSGHNSLHCDAGKNIVLWTYNDANASWWNLEPVELTLDEAAAIHQEYLNYLADKDALNQIAANATDINAALSKVFADAACTEMYEGYKSLSDYRLRQTLAAYELPEEIQEMAVCVKNSTWELEQDAKYNKYVRDFRIADYEPYSDCTVWQGITKVGPFACATNPTGVTVKSGDVLYVYVGDDVKDSDAELKLEIVDDTNRAGTRSQALHKGINTFMAPHNGEVFVFYNVTNRDKYVYAAKGHEADYPNIRVHIEGGEATGMWDAHRGMNDDDWDYLAANMLTAKFLHIKGHNTVIHCVTNNVRNAKRLTDVMKIYDFIFMTEERLIGHDGQWDGRYKPVMCYRDGYTGNPNWGGGSVNVPGLGEGYLNVESLMNERWVTYHEEAHGHQYPINLAATTESSNNGFAQMVNHEFGLTSRRGSGVKTLIDFKNNGWGWVDMLRGGEGTSRTEGFKYYDDCVWAQNHMFYQLYLYFHVAGNMPDFYPRLCDEMRRNGGLKKRGNASNPTLYYEDYFLFAEACAKVSQTDLSDFFDTWGFFDYCEDVKVGNDYTKGLNFVNNDRADLGVRFVGDYGSYYLRMPMRGDEDDERRISELKAFMKSQPKKAPNIMFIDDHILPRSVSPDCFAAQIDPSRIGQDVAYYSGTSKQGDFGDYAQFTGTNEANALDYTISENTVTMSGDGLVGVKIYDNEGNLKYIYNTETFTVPAEVATALADGSMTLVAALGDDTNLPLAKPSAAKHKMIVYNGSAEDCQTYFVTGEALATVPYSTTTAGTDVPVLSGNAMAQLPEDHSAIGLPLSINRANTFVNVGTEDTPSWQATYVNLTDKKDFYLPEGDYKVAGMLSYSRSNTAGLNSVCLPFDVEASAFGTGAKVYEFSLVDGDRISFIEVQKAEAGKFYIVECPTDAPWQLGGSEMTLIGAPTPSDGAYGAFRSGPVADGVYKLNSDGTKFGITKGGKGTVTAFRGYLNPAAPASAAAMPLTLVELGDVNGDGTVSVADVTELVDRLNATMAASNRRQAAPASSQVSAFERQAQRAADVNHDGKLDSTDIEAIISRVFTK